MSFCAGFVKAKLLGKMSSKGVLVRLLRRRQIAALAVGVRACGDE